MKQPPSVGRIVHYYNGNGEGPFAAMIVYVYSADFVRLVMWDKDGKQSVVAGATNPGDPRWLCACWVWPPRVEPAKEAAP